jgi:hypothetical protein
MSAAEIAADNRAFENAIGTGNVEAIAALLTPDVTALPPDGPIVAGREAVKQLWASATGFVKDTGAFVQSLFLTGLDSADVGNQPDLFGEGLASAIMRNRSCADIVSRTNNAVPPCGPVPQISEPACRSTRSGTRGRARSLSSEA